MKPYNSRKVVEFNLVARRHDPAVCGDVPTNCQVTQGSPPVKRGRCAVALKLRGTTHRAVAREAGVTIRHLHYVLDGQRPLSRKVAAALRDALGPAGWAFCTGQTDTLADVAPTAEVQT